MQEAEILLETDLKSVHDLEEAAEKLFDMYKVPFLIKGGHLKDSAIDVLCDNEGIKKFSSELVKEVNNHGSGCTFSSAITSNIVKGNNLRLAISKAKEYIYCSLKYSFNISEFNNVINHFWEIDKK
jgi:hydroxymethylpyrimidine/phosphomethylpyrimidine kinase